MWNTTYIEHYKATLKLATPIILGQIGVMVTSITDTIMVGDLGKEAIAASSLANTNFYLVALFVIGLCVALTPLVGKAYGEKNFDRIGSLLKNSVGLFFVLGTAVSVIIYFGAFLLGKMGQDPDVVELAIPYFELISMSLLPYTLFLVGQQFTEGLGITVPAMVINLVGNVVNIFLNYVLIYGEWGFPELQFEGAGWATGISRVLMLVLMAIYILRSPKMKMYLQKAKEASWKWANQKEIMVLGTPIALQQTLEMGAFTVGAIMVGWYGSGPMAAHHIALMAVALTFRIATGLGSAASVRISQFYGEGRGLKMREAGISSLYLVTVLMGVCAVAIFFTLDAIPYLFTDDAEVLVAAAGLLFIAAIFQVFDGVQAVAMGALRGLQDVRVPTIIAAVAYWGVMVPLGYLLAEEAEMKATGIWIGYLGGLGASSILLAIRFQKKSRQMSNELTKE